MIKVMVVDDHKLIRRGIVLILEKAHDITVVAEAESGCEAISLATQTEPDVVLLDISMPNGLDGFTAAEQMMSDNDRIKIIFLSMHEEEAYIQRAIHLQCAGYILKNSQSSDLHDAIRTVYNGKKYFKVGITEEQLEKMFQNQNKAQSILTIQERKILRLVILGFMNKEIAEKLYISPKTVENHKANIMKKLNLKTKAELIQYGLSNQYAEIKSSNNQDMI